MAGSVNKVILVGNLGRDPEVRYTANRADARLPELLDRSARTLAGVEAMAMLTKGQLRVVPANDLPA